MNTIDILIDDLYNAIRRENDGYSDTVANLVNKYKKNDVTYTTNDLFEIQQLIIAKCKENNIILDFSNWAGKVAGLPFHLSFTKISVPDYRLYYKRLFDKNCFFIEIKSGALLPLNHPNYYKGRKDILICREYDDINFDIKIESSKYSINNEIVDKIEKLISNNYKSLVEISLRQHNKMVAGSYNNLNIKVGSVFLMLSPTNASSQEDKDLINNIEKNIEDLIINYGVIENE